jgi:CHAT domain-containing protein
MVDERGRPQQGFLQLSDIYLLTLSADLVVLSACQTGLGRDMKGEGMIGLTRGFFYAGASRVVASLWNIDDAATAELMRKFYEGILIQKLAPAAALRSAQLETRKQRRYRSPYYWAGFTVQGKWN